MCTMPSSSWPPRPPTDTDISAGPCLDAASANAALTTEPDDSDGMAASAVTYKTSRPLDANARISPTALFFPVLPSGTRIVRCASRVRGRSGGSVRRTVSSCHAYTSTRAKVPESSSVVDEADASDAHVATAYIGPAYSSDVGVIVSHASCLCAPHTSLCSCRTVANGSRRIRSWPFLRSRRSRTTISVGVDVASSGYGDGHSATALWGICTWVSPAMAMPSSSFEPSAMMSTTCTLPAAHVATNTATFGSSTPCAHHPRWAPEKSGD